MKLDKKVLLCYTDVGADGVRHSFSAWFRSERELHLFVRQKRKQMTFQDDFAIEIKNCRSIELSHRR